MQRIEDLPDALLLGQSAVRIQLEQTLASGWETLENKFHAVTVDDSTGEKDQWLRRFFKEAGDVLAEIIHEYFPQLLEIASAHKQHLGGQIPLEWTQAWMRTRVCQFMGLDEEFDEAQEPRSDSRVVSTAAAIVGRKGWHEDRPINEFRLPGWADSRQMHGFRYFPSPESRAEYTARLEKEQRLSRSETLMWLRHRENEIWTKIKGQFDHEYSDGVIASSQKGVSALAASSDNGDRSKPQADPAKDKYQPREGQWPERDNAFYRDGNVWVVCYEGKTCHFQNTVGFQYIWILLRHSGRALAAKQVLALCNAGAGDSISERDVDAYNLSTQDNLQERSDSRAIARYEARAREIETEITIAKRNGQEAEVIRLKDELEQIAGLMTKDRGLFGKRRKFSNDDERARSTVTTAIKRAREKMRKRSSELANYFEEAISTGNDCIFRDAQTVWRLEQPTTTTKH